MPTRPNPRIQDRLRPTGAALLGLALASMLARPAVADDRDGAAIYKEKCISCHGASGEGSADYPRALTGDRTIPQLAKLIAKTMPEDDPGTCVGAEAEKVAAYIHDAFYSRIAQERNRPARIELSRLTVRQYRNAVAELVAGLRGPGRPGPARGLHGEYFKTRRYSSFDRLIDRTDPEVKFDFGTDAPDPSNEKFDAAQFSIRWEGSVLAPETGEYEFIVKTEHALRLFVNDPRRPLIDAFVKSGNDNEYHATIHLLGGRAYPIRLEFTKAKQGVDDSKDKKKKPKPVKASIALEWKQPSRPAEVIPARVLAPESTSETFVVTTPFPPDDRSIGYERGTSVSKEWDRATTDAAIEVTAYVASHLREVADIRESTPERPKRLRAFARQFAERAFRRPLSDEEAEVYVDRQFEEASDPDLALKRSLLLVLKSPRFLYREIGSGLDAYDVASRLSFGLWDSLPDRELLDAAAAGRLSTREQVAQQAERMLPDLRTRSKLRAFLLRWLRVEQVPDLAKDPSQYPGFDALVASDLRTSLDLFLDEVVWGESSDFRQLLTADYVYLNGRLAQFYGMDLAPDDPFQKVYLDPYDRAGVLSHPYLMAAFAYTSTSSPIHRGVFVIRSVLGRGLKPPPEAVAPLAPDLHASLSTRDRVALQTSPAACATCHATINPLGFGLEHFDAVGRYRGEEKGRPIDARGSYESTAGEAVQYDGARALASLLVASDEVHEAFAEQLFHDLVKQPIRAYGPKALDDLKHSFAARGFSIRALAVEIMAASALAPREAPH